MVNYVCVKRDRDEEGPDVLNLKRPRLDCPDTLKFDYLGTLCKNVNFENINTVFSSKKMLYDQIKMRTKTDIKNKTRTQVKQARNRQKDRLSISLRKIDLYDSIEDYNAYELITELQEDSNKTYQYDVYKTFDDVEKIDQYCNLRLINEEVEFDINESEDSDESEDSNAEDHYLNDYPDEESSCDSSSDELDSNEYSSDYVKDEDNKSQVPTGWTSSDSEESLTDRVQRFMLTVRNKPKKSSKLIREVSSSE